MRRSSSPSLFLWACFFRLVIWPFWDSRAPGAVTDCPRLFPPCLTKRRVSDVSPPTLVYCYIPYVCVFAYNGAFDVLYVWYITGLCYLCDSRWRARGVVPRGLLTVTTVWIAGVFGVCRGPILLCTTYLWYMYVIMWIMVACQGSCSSKAPHRHHCLNCRCFWCS